MPLTVPILVLTLVLTPVPTARDRKSLILRGFPSRLAEDERTVAGMDKCNTGDSTGDDNVDMIGDTVLDRGITRSSLEPLVLIVPIVPIVFTVPASAWPV